MREYLAHLRGRRWPRAYLQHPKELPCKLLLQVAPWFGASAYALQSETSEVLQMRKMLGTVRRGARYHRGHLYTTLPHTVQAIPRPSAARATPPPRHVRDIDIEKTKVPGSAGEIMLNGVPLER